MDKYKIKVYEVDENGKETLAQMHEDDVSVDCNGYLLVAKEGDHVAVLIHNLNLVDIATCICGAEPLMNAATLALFQMGMGGENPCKTLN